MVSLFIRGNEALEVNPPTGVNFAITEHGSDWLWAAFSILACSTFVNVFLSFTRKQKRERILYYTGALGTFFMVVLYFTMASNLGWAPVQAEFNHVTIDDQELVPGTRQIFYARYIGWFLAFPTIFISLATIFAVNWTSALFTILCQETTVVALLAGSVVHSSYKWGYFTFAVAAFLIITAEFIFDFRPSAQAVHASKAASIILPLTTVLLMLYPVAWALTDGGNVIQPDSGAVFFGVLDICLFVIIAAIVVFFSNSADFISQGITAHDMPVFHEKFVEPTPTSATEATRADPVATSAEETV